MIYDYAYYAVNNGRTNPDHNPKNFWYKMVNEVESHLDRFPSFKKLLESLIPDYKRYLKEEASYNLNDLGERYGKNFKDENEAEIFIDSITIDQVDAESLMDTSDIDTFVRIAQNSGLDKQILAEFYEYFVFPSWSKYWKARGIEETRKNVENVYKQLQSISSDDMGNMIATISVALNLAHQTGEMIEYLEQDTGEEDLKILLSGLTNGNFVPSANNELKELGISSDQQEVKQESEKPVKKQINQKKPQKAPKKRNRPLKSAKMIEDLRLNYGNNINWYKIAQETDKCPYHFVRNKWFK